MSGDTPASPANSPASPGNVPLQSEVASEIRLDAPKVISWLLIACISIEVAFVLLDYFVNYGRLTEIGPIRRMFNITREDGLASWFGITQTLLAGLTAWFIWLVRRGQPGTKKWIKIGWFILACCLTYMAIDDGATIHERLGSTLKAIQQEGAQADDAQEENAAGRVGGWFPSYHWQVLFLPFFGAMGVFMLVFLWRELDQSRLRMFVAMCLACFVMAVCLDFIEGLDRTHRLNVYSAIAERFDFEAFTRERFKTSEFDTLRHFSKSIEETLEMFGMTLLWVAFLTHLTRIAPTIRITLNSTEGNIRKP